MRNFPKLYFYILLLLSSCKHPDTTNGFIGPENLPVPENFQVLNNQFSAAYMQLDLKDHLQYFTSEFSAKVSWKIKLTGNTSGATKTFLGVGASLTQASTTWAGLSDNNYKFSEGENCTAILSFERSTLTYSTTFLLLRLSSTTSVLLDDFEGTAKALFKLDSSFVDSLDLNVVVNTKDASRKLEGLQSLLLRGTDTNKDYWIAGISTHSKKIGAVFKNVLADSLYYSFYVFGDSSAAGLQVIMREDDDQSGNYTSAKDDAYSYQLSVDWIGWKHLKIPYSSFQLLPAGNGGGNAMKNPDRLIGCSIILFAQSPGRSAAVSIDYVLLSVSQ